MIRDEYLKQKKEKGLSAKEMVKLREVGERAFYGNRIKDLMQTVKVLNFSLIMVGVFILLGVLMVIYSISLENKFTSDLIIPIIATVLFLVAEFIVLFGVLPSKKKKIIKYKERIEELRVAQIKKQEAIYKSMNK